MSDARLERADRADDYERRRMERYLRGAPLDRARRGRGWLRVRWASPFKAAVRALIAAAGFFRVVDQLETRAIWKECSDLTRECAAWLRYNDHKPQPRAGRR